MNPSLVWIEVSDRLVRTPQAAEDNSVELYLSVDEHILLKRK